MNSNASKNQRVHIFLPHFWGKKGWEKITDANNIQSLFYKFFIGGKDIWNKDILENELVVTKTTIRSDKAQHLYIKLLLSIIITMLL